MSISYLTLKNRCSYGYAKIQNENIQTSEEKLIKINNPNPPSKLRIADSVPLVNGLTRFCKRIAILNNDDTNN